MLHTRRGLNLTTVVESVLEGLRQAQEEHGIESNVIICGIRNVSVASSLEMAELAVAYKGRGVVGFDLAARNTTIRPSTTRRRFSSCETTTST